MTSSPTTPRNPMADEGTGVRGVRLATATVLAATAGLAVGAVALASESASTAAAAYEAVVYTAVGGLGVAIARRRPRNPVGWLLQVIALALAANAVGYDVYLRAASSGQVDGAASFAAWCNGWMWLFAIVPAFTIFPLVFPTGRPLSPRWGLLLRVALMLSVLTWFGTAFAPGPLDVAPDVSNPFGLDHPAVEVVGVVGFGLLIPTSIAAIVSLVLRFRKSTGTEREQLKWVAAAAALLPFAFTGLGLRDDETGFLLLMTSLLLVVAAVAVAMLRHRLYDIDVVINRALVYGSLTVLLATSYVGGVLLLQLALRPLTRSSDLAVAGSTLAVAALFRPARERIRGLVDRRFYRSRYDATQTLAQFTAHLRDQLDADALADDICRVVEDTVQPTHVTLWVPTTGRGAP
ncbi:MAG TPA: hypothetical protein VER39_08915 [Nocardioidaceae bacterium]|nr:hypothetical protein [Nocardioidaceae bacterium]